MEYINPIDSIKINEHILIAKECWPEHFGREIEDINIIKQFYNDSYNLFRIKFPSLMQCITVKLVKLIE